jgi:hypothetical protein
MRSNNYVQVRSCTYLSDWWSLAGGSGAPGLSAAEGRFTVEPRQEVKRHGRLPFIKKHGVRRPALRELTRPVSTPAEIRLFSELYAKYPGKASTNWVNLCHEWNQRVALSLSQVTGPRDAIHQKSIALLKRYEKDLVTQIIRKDSLNSLHAYNSFSMQPTVDHPPPSVANPINTFPAPPSMVGHHGPSFSPLTYTPSANPFSGPITPPSFRPPHIPLQSSFQPNQSFGQHVALRPSKNRRGGVGVKKHCRRGCGLPVKDCRCSRPPAS